MFHILWCAIFIQSMKLGIAGAAIAMNITLISNMVLLDFFISRREDFKDTWFSINSGAY